MKDFTREDFLPAALRRIEEELQITCRLRWPRCTVDRQDLELLFEEVRELRRQATLRAANRNDDGSYRGNP